MKNWMWIVILGVAVLMLAPVAMAQEEISPEEEEEILDIVSGKVAGVDLAGNKLTITNTGGATQEFVLDPNLTTVWDDASDEEKELSDLAAGKDVVVEFRVDEAGKKIASWIDIVVAEEEVPAEPGAPEAPPVEGPAVQ